jgi:RNA polymerase sigma factor (sigma-70 family)
MHPPAHEHQLMADLFRRESGRLIALLVSRVGAGRIDTVEDAVQDALVSALRRWPIHGIPANPSGWLYTAARNALIDRLRRSRFESPTEAIDAAAGETADELSFTAEEKLNDELLRLIVYCCHPALSRSMQLALTLRLACGLGVHEIAGALLTTSESIAQRIVRAKRQLREWDVQLELPPDDELVNERLPGILNSIYLLFDAGYLSAHHEEWLRPALCADALRIVRLLADHPATAEPETHALAALLHFTAARLPARTDAQGRPVPLPQQNRAKWDRAMIRVGFAYFGAAIRGDALTRYHIESAIAAEHARAASMEETDWQTIVSHYDQLCELYPSPVASLNRIIALRYARGAQIALAALQDSDVAERLQDSLAFHATLAELYDALGESAKAADAFRSAAELAGSSTLADVFRERQRSASSTRK